MLKLKIDSVPPWFAPPHEVELNANFSVGCGSYGSVHRGSWNGTVVVIKSALLAEDKSREMFSNETKIWIKLQHSHIVTLLWDMMPDVAVKHTAVVKQKALPKQPSDMNEARWGLHVCMGTCQSDRDM